MSYTDYTLSERILIGLNPAFRCLSKRWPAKFGRTDEPCAHPSAMLTERGWVYSIVIPRFFRNVEMDRSALEPLKAAAENSTIIYIIKNLDQIAYHYFNDLFEKETLPLACFTNAFTLRRFMTWPDLWASIKNQENEITECKCIKDPIRDNAVFRWAIDGKSVLLSIPESDLAEEDIFFTGPVRALSSLIEAQKQSPRPILIVPIDFLWSTRPKKDSRSLGDILFGEKEFPGRIRKTILFWKHLFTTARATIGTPINLGEFAAEHPGLNDRDATNILRKRLSEVFHAQRNTVTGPMIRPRSWFVQEVTGDESLDARICRMAAECNKPVDTLRELAARYAKEIAADVNYTYIELLERILGPVFNDLFESFDVDYEGLRRVKELYAKGPVVFVPNHKSHADYLILSYLLHTNGMTIPHIAAGINLEFWPLGNIFRHCGAYFIRRAFRDNPLYRAVLETYLKILLRQGYSQEFFIEGGRSRTGKLAKPRKGMLTMLHSAAKEAGIHNMSLIPVSITYDRVIEQKSYIHELEGGTKEKEKTSHILRLTKFLKRQKHRYGSIYVRFGKPVAQLSNTTEKSAINEIAQDICHEINRNLVVTPAGIAAAAILAPAKRGVSVAEVKRSFDAILSYLESKNVGISNRMRSAKETASEDALAKLANTKLIVPHKEALKPFYFVDEDRRIPLSFFKNGIVHFLVSIGVVSTLVKKAAFRGREISQIELVSGFKMCQELLAHEFKFATRCPVDKHVCSALDYLNSQNALCGAWICDLFASQLRPFVETLWIALSHASERLKSPIESRALLADMIKTGNEMLLLGEISHREAVTKDGLDNALRALISHGIITLEFRGSGSKRRKIYTPTDNAEAIQKLKVKLEELL